MPVPVATRSTFSAPLRPRAPEVLMVHGLDVQAMVVALKAAAEPTRLRILILLAEAELNVSDLTHILGQSQPRISRHLKLLVEAGLIERFRDGSFVFFHLAERARVSRLIEHVLAAVDLNDRSLTRDRERAQALRSARTLAAQGYFERHAAHWDEIRALHVDEHRVEQAMLEALGAGPFDFLVDLGTGTGRMLEVFAQSYVRGLGLDANHAMLAYARSKLGNSQRAHAHVRHGDIYALALADQVANAVIMHQVLHFLTDPARAVAEAARILAPGGKLLIVDFAPHELEFLRKTQNHERLGFAKSHVAAWMADAGLIVHELPDLNAHAVDAEPANRLTVSLWLAERPKHGPQALSRASNTMKPALEVQP